MSVGVCTNVCICEDTIHISCFTITIIKTFKLYLTQVDTSTLLSSQVREHAVYLMSRNLAWI